MTYPNIRKTPRRAARDGSILSARFVLACARTVHGGAGRRMPEARALLNWIGQNAAGLGIAEKSVPGYIVSSNPGPVADAIWRGAGPTLARAAGTAGREPPALAETWLASVAGALALDELEAALLALSLHYQLDHRVETLCDSLSSCRGGRSSLSADARLLALLLGANETDIQRRLAPGGRLLASGVMEIERDGDLDVLTRLRVLIARGTPVPADIRDALLGAVAVPDALPWEDFSHLGAEAEPAAAVLAGALARGERGVGILLYGPPGTGKTSFASSLAARVGARLRPVGEADEDGDEPTREERFAALRLAQRLICDGRTALLFDEAEDLFGAHEIMDGVRLTGSRVFMHRMLERMSVPVIWTANDIGPIGPASLRRMAMCIRMELPTVAVRARLWRRLADAAGVALSEPDAAAMARTLPAAPAVAASGLRAASLAGGGTETARLVVEGIARAVNGGQLPAPEPHVAGGFDPDLVNADTDLAALTDRLAAHGAPRAVSLLLSGPPGGGKTAFARHLAARMGLPVMARRASNLLNAYVGGTEQNIAGAFAEARAAGAFLVFDEADSLLLDRASAVRSWEVSQVNEMLTWMEDHPLPFAATTNMAERLDGASLRRFLVKLRFDWLRPDQARRAFRWFFDLPAPSGLDDLRTLTPADFALVARRRAFLGSADSGVLLDLLRAECSGRVGGRVSLGFGR